MKKKFSVKWRASRQKRKQRKYRYESPLHVKYKMLSSNLSKELRKKYSKRSLPLRKEDTVRVMRGEFKGKRGKIGSLDKYNFKVYIEGMQKDKKDGTKVSVPFHPSNLQITELNLDDKKRSENLERKETTKEKKAK